MEGLQFFFMKKATLLLPFLFFACQGNETVVSETSIYKDEIDTLTQHQILLEENELMRKIAFEIEIDSLFLANNLVDIQTVNKNIRVDVRYSTRNNFVGIQLYDTIKKIYLNRTVAERLSFCQEFLDSIRPGYSLLIYDGVRPLQVQKEMWDALDSIPVYRRGKFVSNPARGSVHNYGAAVDLTLVDSLGNILDMGAGYDDFNEIAFPSLESRFLKSGELTTQQWENRKLLRKVMRKEGFRNIPSEWWHFNAYSRVISSRKFKRILDESGHADWNKLEYPKKDTIGSTN